MRGRTVEGVSSGALLMFSEVESKGREMFRSFVGACWLIFKV
jgi:hypothetical protein